MLMKLVTSFTKGRDHYQWIAKDFLDFVYIKRSLVLLELLIDQGYDLVEHRLLGCAFQSAQQICCCVDEGSLKKVALFLMQTARCTVLVKR
jgi:hypothetical protein